MPRPIQNECDDCGMVNARWASLSHGVFLCDECSCAHRSLGRHVSQVRCLKSGPWPPSLLNMVFELNNKQINRFLESELNVEKGSKKPCAFDDIETKTSFVREKYEIQQYMAKYKPISSEEERIKVCEQLHSCVRTDEIDMTLKLLLMGADPNFRSGESARTVIGAAAASGNSTQVELLCIWGGDPAATDAHGRSPEFICRSLGYNQLADRLFDLENELVDKLMSFAGRRRRGDIEFGDSSNEGKTHLRELPDHVFEDFVRDLYDEIDRRDSNALVLSLLRYEPPPRSKSVSESRFIVPFLPVNPAFSATRNQGRQKLARFPIRDFLTLIHDVVKEMKRRRLSANSPLLTNGTRHIHALPHISELRNTAELSDDEPLYDHVASNDDEDEDEDDVDEGQACQNASHDVEFGRELKLRVMKLESQLKQLTCVNEELRHEMISLKQHLLGFFAVRPLAPAIAHLPKITEASSSATMSSPENNQAADERISQTMESDYDNTNNLHDDSADAYAYILNAFAYTTDKEKGNASAATISAPLPLLDNGSAGSAGTVNPLYKEIEEVVMMIIRRIADFHELIKDKRRDEFLHAAIRIEESVKRMSSLLPSVSESLKSMRLALFDLNVCARRLCVMCRDSKSPPDHLIDCCYEIGCCTKRLVALLSPVTSSPLGQC